MAWITETILTAAGTFGLSECVTEARLAELTGLKAHQVEKSALLLRKHGLLEKTARGCHKITDAGREALAAGLKIRTGPKGKETGHRVWKKDTMRARMWRAMRLRRKFTVHDLITLSVDGTESGDVTASAQRYVYALYKAGYLVRLKAREAGQLPKSKGYTRWWLQDDKDTGPKAPIWSGYKGIVYDQNTGTAINLKGARP